MKEYECVYCKIISKDHIAACKEVDKLKQQLAERDELILELSNKVNFYGNWKSWDTTSHAYHDRYNGSIKADDSLVHYIENDGDKFSGYFGGKLARTPLKNQTLLDEIKLTKDKE